MISAWLTQQPVVIWLLLAGAALVLIALARRALRAFYASRWRRRAPLSLEHPVVLVHGIFGFGEIGSFGLEQQYFRGLRYYLELLGAEVHVPQLPLADRVETRAERLADFLRALDKGPVVLIAHSLGGLDARYAIQHFDLGDRVTKLITVGTPHRGTPVASIGRSAPVRLIRWVWTRIGLKTGAVDALTERSMARFNEEVTDDERVEYLSVVAVAKWRTMLFNPALWITWAWLRARGEPNDGLVTAASQRWGRVIGEVNADHWAQIGWSLRFDARRFYERLLRQLGETR